MATDPHLIIGAARGWIGTPYRHQASRRGVGCDCLGLLRGVWRELHGAEPQSVPPYAPDWGGAETLRDGLARYLAAVPLDTIKPGDVALFRLAPRGPARHCGIVGESDGRLTLIHARQNRAVREEAFLSFWRARLAYLFRV
jgi:NlpC/P60 family putative phage cell wall peptidase